ncbi:hypothetical protein H6S82_23400 [Planktothrix sp. FACHB-1355]|uniref:Uncharacterized protein n=1 Tax=Aerosakkonema funiforme FACHB-1375 TaxID=2949571 RepID=A0A926VDE9_9CYAN|nr:MULTISPECIES: hypothetical protein [Oscillatoriales]MBD2180837.1 hypothetical protein [Aerosakkonema funiforme FACHB-1375]MBD3561766.1 hypothetical protein [Planktothrix sp. FACHB-1355]
MISAVNFQPSQIVCLEHQATRLYAEVIQIIESRQMCWVRPLMIAIPVCYENAGSEQYTLYDLRQGADLVWPSILFRPALDVEVIPLFTHLQTSKTQTHNTQLAHQHLQDFIRQVWLAYQNYFKS